MRCPGRGGRSARRAPAPARRPAGLARGRAAAAGRPTARAPSSPTNVSRPSGSARIQSQIRARRRACSTSASLASGRGRRTLSRMLAEKRCDSWPATEIARRTSARRVVAKVALRERHASRFGIEEAQQQVGDGGLPGAAGADERDALTRRESQADAIQSEIRLVRVAGAHVVERDGERPGRRRGRHRRVAHGRLPRGQLEQPAAGRERGRQLAGRGGERRDRLEGGQREQRQHRDQHAVELPVGRRVDRDARGRRRR